MNKVKINELVNEIHDNNVKSGWWTNLQTGESLKSKQGETPKRNIPEMLCLIHSEISEAMEGHRKNLMDDKLSPIENRSPLNKRILSNSI